MKETYFEEYFRLKAEIEALQDQLKEVEQECFLLAHQGVVPRNVKYSPPKNIPPRKMVNKNAMVELLKSFGMTDSQIEEAVFTVSKPGLRKPKLVVIE